MKTPREILLSRHSEANAELDSIRERVVADECHLLARNSERETRNLKSLPDLVLKLWRELILPARRVWAGFAVVWIAIALFNFASTDRASGTMAKAKPGSGGILAVWQEQRKVVAELTDSPETIDADKPKMTVPRPHSERRAKCSIV
jgi:hypothetical protein